MTALAFEPVTDVIGVPLAVLAAVLWASVDLVPTGHRSYRSLTVSAGVALVALVVLVGVRFAVMAG